jgi:hypothetical protein
MKEQMIGFSIEAPWRVFRFMAECCLSRLGPAVIDDIGQATDIFREYMQRAGPTLRMAKAFA